MAINQWKKRDANKCRYAITKKLKPLKKDKRTLFLGHPAACNRTFAIGLVGGSWNIASFCGTHKIQLIRNSHYHYTTMVLLRYLLSWDKCQEILQPSLCSTCRWPMSKKLTDKGKMGKWTINNIKVDLFIASSTDSSSSSSLITGSAPRTYLMVRPGYLLDRSLLIKAWTWGYAPRRHPQT